MDHLCDAFFILDTGSNDNTVEVAKKVLKEIGKPFDVQTEPWINFGKSRSRSFILCKIFAKKHFKLATTFALAVDADMCCVCQDVSKLYSFLSDNKPSGFHLIQKNSSLSYRNMRLMRLSKPWKCVGATHEYWGCEGDTNLVPDDIMYIDDKNDGGCKADKYERDLKLLLEDERNDRNTFYIAQTYQCLGKHKESIEWYTKRTEMGGWYQEVWFSMYRIATSYLVLEEEELAEAWVRKALKSDKSRSEALYAMCKHYRVKGNHKKAYEYYLMGKDIPLPVDALFVETNVYKFLFTYEFTIIAYYIAKNLADAEASALREAARKASEKYIEEKNEFWQSVQSNIKFYQES